MPHVLVAGKVHPSGIALLNAAHEVTFDYVEEISEPSYAPLVGKADGIVIRTQPLSAGTVDKAGRLRIVSRHGVGYDSVDLPALKIGQAVAVTPAGTVEPLKGIVRLIAPEVDKASRLGRLRITLTGNPPVAVGSLARGVIETGRKTVVTLPLSAIAYTRSGATVQSVTDGKITTKKVVLGLAGHGRDEIVSGVAEGETVVARAGTFVRDGDVITPIATN